MPVYENTSVIERKTRLSTLALEDNLHAFKIETSTKRMSTNGDLKIRPEAKTPVIQGLVDDKNLANLLAGKSYSTRTGAYNNGLIIMSAQGRELMRTEGYNTAWDKQRSGSIMEQSISQDYYDMFESGKATVDDLVTLKHDSHMLLDRNGEPLPVAIFFDYIAHGRISNANYDLKKLVSHLMTRDDIVIFGKSESRPWRDEPDYTSEKKLETMKDAILPIPHYNSEAGKSHTVYFKWMPSREDYLKMWEECTAKKSEYPSTKMHEAIFKLDLLGLRKCGAALHKEYWKDTEHKRDPYEDDDELNSPFRY